jgi:ADP-glucose pyrophosphorylase
MTPNASVIVFESAHMVLDIDLRPIIEEHIARHEAMTVVYKKINDADQEFRKGYVYDIDKDGYVDSIHKNDGRAKNANVSLGDLDRQPHRPSPISSPATRWSMLPMACAR